MKEENYTNFKSYLESIKTDKFIVIPQNDEFSINVIFFKSLVSGESKETIGALLSKNDKMEVLFVGKKIYISVDIESYLLIFNESGIGIIKGFQNTDKSMTEKKTIKNLIEDYNTTTEPIEYTFNL